MEIYKTQSEIAGKSNWLLSLIVTILITLGVLALLSGLSVFLILPLLNIPFDELAVLLTAKSNHPNGRMAFLFIQAMGGGLSFIVAALLIAKVVDKASFGWKQQTANFKFNGFAIMLLVLLGGMLFNGLLIEWNANFQFPEFLSDLEKSVRAKEDHAMALTKYLTDFEGIGEFLTGILVIGVLAGVGEELLFRGVLQPKLHLYTGNAHLGIWITAFIFSAIHFQFYGFLPRMLLGAIFGYLYYFSGSLIYPVLAHILNNTVTVVLVYLNKLGIVNFNIEDTDQVSVPLALLGLLILVLGLNYFKTKTQIPTPNEKLEESL